MARSGYHFTDYRIAKQTDKTADGELLIHPLLQVGLLIFSLLVNTIGQIMTASRI